jgi:small-conductance mechanosensitive channel
VQREFNRRVAELFQARGIQIANPQRTVFVQGGGRRPAGKEDEGAPAAETPDAPDASGTPDAPAQAAQRSGSAKPAGA